MNWAKLVVLFVVCMTWSFYASALEEQLLKPKKFDVPMREHSVIVTDEGYYPKHISLFVGEKIHFYLTSTLPNPSCLLMPDKNLFLSAVKGKVSEGEAFFNKAGTYKFYCPTGKIVGRITVLAKKVAEEERPKKRAPASVSKKLRVWRPRAVPKSMMTEEELEEEENVSF
jgi:hypothetical protein